MTKTLMTAIASAVAQMADPKKNASNPHFKNTYADLGEVLGCIEKPLADNGLLLLQLPMLRNNDKCVLNTQLIHIESGDHIEYDYPLRPVKEDPQMYGSAISYARRYTIKSMFGMFDVDDDSETASGRGKAKKAKQQEPDAPKSEAPAPSYDNVETAIAAMNACDTMDKLIAVWRKTAACGFRGVDLQAAVEAKEDMKTQLSASTGTEEQN